MQSPKRKNRWIKALAITFGVAIVLAIVVQVVGSAYVKPLVGRQLQQLILNGSDNLYRFSYTGIGINLWTGSVTVTGVKLSVDSLRFGQLKKAERLPSLTLGMDVEKIRMRRFNVVRFLFSRDMHIAQISTENANISLYRHFRPNTPKAKQAPVPVWKLIRPEIHSIFVRTLRLDNIRLSYYNVENNNALAWRFDRFDTRISDIQIDSASALDNQRLLYAKDIEVDVQQLAFFTPDSLYKLSAKHFSYSLQKSELALDSLQLEPGFPKEEFYRRTKMEKDIYTVRMASVRLVNFNPEQFISYNLLQADSLLLTGGEIDIYHDRNLPDDTASKLGKFPHQILLKAPMGIYIQMAVAKNLRVVYTEKNDLTRQEGQIYFNDVQGTAIHLTNLPEEIAKKGYCEVWVKGRFMKETGINGKFVFDLTRTDGTFSAEAHMTPTDVTVLNPVTEALGSARFKSLRTGHGYYRIHGNEYGAYGHLELPYSNLHMQILQLPKEGKDTRHKHLMTWMVKNFSFNENPGKNEELRIAHNVYNKRHIRRSFFNLIWKTMYACAKDVATKEGAKKFLQKRKVRKDKKM